MYPFRHSPFWNGRINAVAILPCVIVQIPRYYSLRFFRSDRISNKRKFRFFCGFKNPEKKISQEKIKGLRNSLFYSTLIAKAQVQSRTQARQSAQKQKISPMPFPPVFFNLKNCRFYIKKNKIRIISNPIQTYWKFHVFTIGVCDSKKITNLIQRTFRLVKEAQKPRPAIAVHVRNRLGKESTGGNKPGHERGKAYLLSVRLPPHLSLSANSLAISKR